MWRWLQFRLRAALALMALCSLACAWVGAHLRQWRTEQQVLAAIGPAAIEEANPPVVAPVHWLDFTGQANPPPLAWFC